MSEESGITSTAPEIIAEDTVTKVEVAQKPTEQAVVEPAKAETDEPEETPNPEKDAEAEAKKGKNREARRIDKMHRERAEAIARGDSYQRQFEELQASMRPKAPQGAPKLEDFEDIDSYANAVATYRITENDKAREQNQRQASEQQQASQLEESWEKQVDEGESKYDDFHAKVGSYKPDPNIPWSRAIMSADNGADVAYYLQSNFKEAQIIAQLDGFSQVFEIGKLAAKLASQTPAARKASQAPSPIKPLSGGSTNTDRKLAEVDSQDEFDKRRREYIAQKR